MSREQPQGVVFDEAFYGGLEWRPWTWSTGVQHGMVLRQPYRRGERMVFSVPEQECAAESLRRQASGHPYVEWSWLIPRSHADALADLRELSAWQDQAVASCSAKGCLTIERRLREAEKRAELAEAREIIEELRWTYDRYCRCCTDKGVFGEGCRTGAWLERNKPEGS